MKNVIILEIGRVSGIGQILIDQYLPVDSIETGIAIAKESLKEYIRPNTVIEQLAPLIWVVTEKCEVTGDLVRVIQIKKHPLATLETLKQVIRGKI